MKEPLLLSPLVRDGESQTPEEAKIPENPTLVHLHEGLDQMLVFFMLLETPLVLMLPGTWGDLSVNQFFLMLVLVLYVHIVSSALYLMWRPVTGVFAADGMRAPLITFLLLLELVVLELLACVLQRDAPGVVICFVCSAFKFTYWHWGLILQLVSPWAGRMYSAQTRMQDE